MTTQDNPKTYTTSEIRLSSLQSEVQPIAADYYNLTTTEGSPVAGLLVLLDRRRRPVRAELHLNPETRGTVQEMAHRQARTLLQGRYFGSQPLPLSLVRDHLEREVDSVALAEAPPAGDLRRPRLWAGVAGIVVVLAVLAGWGLSGLWRGEGAARQPTAVQPAVADRPAVEEGESGVETAASSSVNPFPPRTNGLPESRNALPLAIGQRVRIRPTWRLTLRSEPGVDVGEAVGYLQDGESVVIVGGPVWKQGESDTIVWWYVRVDATGQEAWAPANTSTLTLLEPTSE